jgi:hypothetical protein
LTKVGVDIHFETPYTEGQDINCVDGTPYEVIVDCRGYKFMGPSFYMQDDFSSCLDKKSGQIMVNSKGQVTNVHPLVGKTSNNAP